MCSNRCICLVSSSHCASGPLAVCTVWDPPAGLQRDEAGTRRPVWHPGQRRSLLQKRTRQSLILRRRFVSDLQRPPASVIRVARRFGLQCSRRSWHDPSASPRADPFATAVLNRHPTLVFHYVHPVVLLCPGGLLSLSWHSFGVLRRGVYSACHFLHPHPSACCHLNAARCPSPRCRICPWLGPVRVRGVRGAGEGGGQGRNPGSGQEAALTLQGSELGLILCLHGGQSGRWHVLPPCRDHLPTAGHRHRHGATVQPRTQRRRARGHRRHHDPRTGCHSRRARTDASVQTQSSGGCQRRSPHPHIVAQFS